MTELLDRREIGPGLRQHLGGELVGRVIGNLRQAHPLERVILLVRGQAGNVGVEHRLARFVGDDGLDRSVEVQPRGRHRVVGGHRLVGGHGVIGGHLLRENRRSGGGGRDERGGKQSVHGKGTSGSGSARCPRSRAPSVSPEMNAA